MPQLLFEGGAGGDERFWTMVSKVKLKIDMQDEVENW